tara:strand:+ start:344 stop:877 length:534 start_codon:yes stop_codon:yes gene_type:complete
MTRSELNNLARNKYCDDKIQVWIAHNAHIQARYYLADNPSLCEEATNVLLKGRSRIVKGMLVGSSAVDDPDTIRHIYSELRLRLNNWRVNNFFVRNYWGRTISSTATPSDVLSRIYKDYVDVPEDNHTRYWIRNLERNIASHPNCPLPLAIRFSQSDKPDVKKAGFDAIVRINTQKN